MHTYALPPPELVNAVKILGDVKNLFEKFKTRHDQILSESQRNGGTGEEAVTLPHEDSDIGTETHRSLVIVNPLRNSIDTFMGTEDFEAREIEQ